MAKPTVYVETTVIGHLVGRMHRGSPVVSYRQRLTREWWRDTQHLYQFFVSEPVILECGAGDAEAAAERIEFLRQFDLAIFDHEAAALANELTRRRAIPPTEPRDAFHVSIAAVNGIQFLVTWNFKHIANVHTAKAIEQTCEDFGYEPPRICTPEELVRND